MRTALVTGGTGFIGSHLLRRLSLDGWRVRAALRRPEDDIRLPSGADPFLLGDLGAGLPLSAAGQPVDAVFHLAGLAHEAGLDAAPADFFRVNAEGTRRLLAACEAAGARRFVFFSSVAAELGANPYGLSKREAESHVLAASGGKMTTVCLRLPLVYGPGQKGNLQKLARMIARGPFPALAWAGNRRSFAHVDNVVEAALLAAESPLAAGQIYTVTDAEAYSTAEICRWLRQALGRRGRAWDIPRPVLRSLAAVGDLATRLRGRSLGFDSAVYDKLFGDLVFDSEKIARDLGYRPRSGLRDAIPEIVRGVL